MTPLWVRIREFGRFIHVNHLADNQVFYLSERVVINQHLTGSGWDAIAPNYKSGGWDSEDSRSSYWRHPNRDELAWIPVACDALIYFLDNWNPDEGPDYD